MDYNKFTAEDFVLDSRFRKWILEEDSDLSIFWGNFLKENPHKLETLKEAKKLLLTLPDIHYHISDSKIDDIWFNIENQLEISTPKPKPVVVRALNSGTVLHKKPVENNKFFTGERIRGIAASILLLLTFTYGYFAITQNKKVEPDVNTPVSMIKSTPWGQKTTTYLSDGSEVILNAGSSITYLHDFSKEERVIHLIGEAYFKVAKDSQRPFKVVTGDLVTEALGTEFNVSAYNLDSVITVALAEGKVLVGTTSQNKISGELLAPGEGVQFTAEENSISKFDFDQKETLAWKDGIIYFKNASEKEVINYLEKWYGVEIQVRNKSPKKWAFSGEFKNLSLENVLRSIGFTMGFRYERNEKNVTINYKPVKI